MLVNKRRNREDIGPETTDSVTRGKGGSEHGLVLVLSQLSTLSYPELSASPLWHNFVLGIYTDVDNYAFET